MTQCSILNNKKDKEFVVRPIACMLLTLQGDIYELETFHVQSPSWADLHGQCTVLVPIFSQKGLHKGPALEKIHGGSVRSRAAK